MSARFRYAVGLGIACLALLLWVSSAETASADPASSNVSGEVVRVDAAAQRLVLKTVAKNETRELTFVVDKTARISRGTEVVALSDLKPGEQVSVTYQMKGERRLAERISIPHATPPVAAPPPGGGAMKK